MKIPFLIVLLSLLGGDQDFEWLSFKMVKRVNAQGKTTRMDALIFFKKNGDMVTYLDKPTELFILNNSEGELQIYNPDQNSVYKSVNANYGSQNNPFYYFLGEVPNMGLEQVGYKLTDTKVDDGFLVSTWAAPPSLGSEIKSIELVSDGDKAVFMGFKDKEDAYFKKMYFYQFTKLRGLTFPEAITEIDYIEEDSIITKTTFHDFNFDNVGDKEILNFQIPENATLLK